MEAQNKPQVTKDWLAVKLKENPQKVVGRILSAIYKNQTHIEQANSSTNRQNGIGFCKPDARVGSIGARMFNSKGYLAPWLITLWLKPAKDGYPRICKYASQLNEIAEKKRMQIKKYEKPNLNVIML